MAEPVEATFSISIGIVFNSGITLAHGQQESEYFGSVSATGTSKIKYSLKEGSTLPEGLTLNSNGEITGTPTEAGIFVFTVVANADGKIGDEITLTLYVANGAKTAEAKSQSNTAYIPQNKKKAEEA